MELGSSGLAVKLCITHTIEREASKFIVAVSAEIAMFKNFNFVYALLVATRKRSPCCAIGGFQNSSATI